MKKGGRSPFIDIIDLPIEKQILEFSNGHFDEPVFSTKNNIALFTIEVGKDPVYFQSVHRYFPYNIENFAQGEAVDNYLFTDRDEKIEGIINIPCKTFVIDVQNNKQECMVSNDMLQTSPVISIVMPVYNVPTDYMKESIESILNQTFGDFELLIIDDGSSETQGIEIIQNNRDSRIRLIKNNHDFVGSLNKGIAESKGKYIARMDADDIMLPHRLQKQYDFMEEHPEIDVCGSWMEVFGNSTYIIHLPEKHNEIIASLLLYNTMAHPTIIMRKTSVFKNGTDLYKKTYNSAEDYKLWTDLALKGLHFANIPEVLLKYRSSESQVSNTRNKEMKYSSLKIKLEYAELVMQQVLEVEEKFFNFFESLISLLNENKIDFERMLFIVYQIYCYVLNKKITN